MISKIAIFNVFCWYTQPESMNLYFFGKKSEILVDVVNFCLYGIFLNLADHFHFSSLDNSVMCNHKE